MIFYENSKTLYFGVHFELFLPILREELFLKICFCHFSVSKFLSLCRIFAKTDEQISRKTDYRHTETRTKIRVQKLLLSGSVKCSNLEQHFQKQTRISHFKLKLTFLSYSKPKKFIFA